MLQPKKAEITSARTNPIKAADRCALIGIDFISSLVEIFSRQFAVPKDMYPGPTHKKQSQRAGETV